MSEFGKWFLEQCGSCPYDERLLPQLQRQEVAMKRELAVIYEKIEAITRYQLSRTMASYAWQARERLK